MPFCVFQHIGLLMGRRSPHWKRQGRFIILVDFLNNCLTFNIHKGSPELYFETIKLLTTEVVLMTIGLEVN
jgi:hypothetical protein